MKEDINETQQQSFQKFPRGPAGLGIILYLVPGIEIIRHKDSTISV
jgi:hypothetical protein